MILFIVLGGGISFVFVFKNNMADKTKTNNVNVQMEGQEGNEEDEKNNEPEVNDSFLIEGVEYVDTSRNFKDVTPKKFSFFIDNNRENYLTYIDNNENSNVTLSMVDNNDNSVCAVFSFYNNGSQSDIIVSNEDYMLKNKKVIDDNKTPMWTEERYTSYIARYNSSFYIYQFVVKIDDVEFSIFVLSKKSGDENVKITIEKLIDCLSVNKKVGFYMGWFLSYGSMSNITLKSYKNIGYIVVRGNSGKNPNKIIINGNVIDYQGAMSSWENSELLEINQVYGKWEDMNVGYYTSNYSFGDSLVIYIYGATKEIDGKEYFVDSPYLFEVQKYQESGMTEQEIIKLLLDHLVKYVRQ